MTTRLGALACSIALVVGACATSSSSGTATPATAAAPTTSEPADLDPPPAAPTTDAARILSVDPAAYAETDAMFEAMRAAFEANDFEPTREIMLQQFDIAFGTDLAGSPGAFPAAPVDSSDILQQIDGIWDEFSADEQQAIADRVRLEFESADFGGAIEGDASTTPADTEGLARPAGFARGPLRYPAPFDETGSIFEDAHRDLIGKLGGPNLDFSWSIGSLSDADPGERGHIAVWAIQARPGFLGGLLDDLLDRTCPTVIYPVPGVNRAQLGAAIMHELFHCWSWSNGERTGYISTPPWFQEGVATWAGSQYSPSGLGEGWWNAFASRETFSLYRESYAALGFWTQLAELLGGEAELWDRIPAFNTSAGIGDNANLFDFITASLSRSELAGLASSALQQPAYGGLWEVSGADVTTTGRNPISITIDSTTGSVIEATPFARQKLLQFQISSRLIDDPWIIRLYTDGLVAARWSTGEEFTYVGEDSAEFCIGESCVCPDGSLPNPGVTRIPAGANALDVGLTGAARDHSGVAIELVVLDGDCEEEEATPPPLASGAFNGNGLWRATNPALATMFADASVFGFGAEPLSIAGVTGDVLMELREDGTGTLTYTDVTAFINDSPLGDLTINGTGEFLFGVSAGVLTVSGSTFKVSASSSALLGEAIVITDRDIEGGVGSTSTYTVGFNGNQLVLTDAAGTSGAVFFPTLWTRV